MEIVSTDREKEYRKKNAGRNVHNSVDRLSSYPASVWRGIWESYANYPSRMEHRSQFISSLVCKSAHDDTPNYAQHVQNVRDLFPPSERDITESRISRHLSSRPRIVPSSSSDGIYTVRLPFCRLLIDVNPCMDSPPDPPPSFMPVTTERGNHIHVLLWDTLDDSANSRIRRNTNYRNIIVHIPYSSSVDTDVEDDALCFFMVRHPNASGSGDPLVHSWRNINDRWDGIFT